MNKSLGCKKRVREREGVRSRGGEGGEEVSEREREREERTKDQVYIQFESPICSQVFGHQSKAVRIDVAAAAAAHQHF